MTDGAGKHMSQQTVRFGIVGVGFGASRCAMIKALPGAELVAVSSRDEQKARDAGAQFGADWYTDYRRMLEREDIDVIGVYTPSAQHRDIAVEAAQAGKHLIITKPIEITLERVDDMIAACQTNGVKMATEYYARYEQANYTLHQTIQSGALGRPILGEFSEKLYRPQWYYNMDGGWRSRWATGGGGTVINQGIHTLDQMVWMFGEVASVTSRAGAFASDIESEDTAVVLVDFKNGAVGTFIGTTTFHNPRPGGRYGGGMYRRIELNGTTGSARVEDADLSLLYLEGGKEPPVIGEPLAKNVFDDMARWVRDDAYEQIADIGAAGGGARLDGTRPRDLQVRANRQDRQTELKSADQREYPLEHPCLRISNISASPQAISTASSTSMSISSAWTSTCARR